MEAAVTVLTGTFWLNFWWVHTLSDCVCPLWAVRDPWVLPWGTGPAVTLPEVFLRLSWAEGSAPMGNTVCPGPLSLLDLKTPSPGKSMHRSLLRSPIRDRERYSFIWNDANEILSRGETDDS